MASNVDRGSIRGDGRRGRVKCRCGRGDLDAELDTVDDTIYLRCPDCEADILVGGVIEASVTTTTTVESIADLDPKLRELMDEQDRRDLR